LLHDKAKKIAIFGSYARDEAKCGVKTERMDGKDFPRQIEKLKTEWLDAFKQMQNYYETECFKSFGIEYDAST